MIQQILLNPHRLETVFPTKLRCFVEEGGAR